MSVLSTASAVLSQTTNTTTWSAYNDGGRLMGAAGHIPNPRITQTWRFYAIMTRCSGPAARGTPFGPGWLLT